MPLPTSWSTCPIFGTWTNADTTRVDGTYEISVDNDVRNNPTDTTLLAGVFDKGDLVTTAGSPTLNRAVPIVDDPDNSGDFTVTVKLKITSGQGRTLTFVLAPTQAQADAGGIDLTQYVSAAQLAAAGLVANAPGGFPTLDASGYLSPDVFDPDLNIGGGGGGGLDPDDFLPSTWTPDADQVMNLVEKVQDIVAATLDDGYGIGIVYNDTTGKIEVSSTAGLTSEAAITSVGAAIVGEGLDVLVDDNGPDDSPRIVLTVAVPTWASIVGADAAPDYIAAGQTPQEAREAIGAGTSDVEVGDGPGDAKAGDWQPDVDDVVGLADLLTTLLADTPRRIFEVNGSYTVPPGNTRPLEFMGATNPGALMDPNRDIWYAT